MFARVLTISALLSVAAAQLNLSQACTKALTTIATNPEANACLTPSPLIPILGDSNASIVEPINNWLTSLCAAPSCSNDTLAAIVTNATTGCLTELSSLGFQSSDTAGITTIIQQYYPTARKVVCLKDGDTNCVTQTLTNIQNIFGPLSIKSIFSFNPGDKTIPANLSCTNCIKAAYNTIKADIPGFSRFNNDLENQCGASFNDGATPAGISQSASDKTADKPGDNKDSSAFILSAFSGATVLVAVSSVFALLV
ncbi:hypothetical protein D9615_009759 [Tricholomella constricta]|uniref:Uncharacterized protein n=1 Tax=Tricholomella constricta TaxID=117010 RepID=A0A8H5GT42_9AGAR|nr:hypothetical protein D9615_009759 [Tricholomella constricta]